MKKRKKYDHRIKRKEWPLKKRGRFMSFISAWRWRHSGLLAVSLGVILLVISSASTFAWFIVRDAVDNNFKTSFQYQVELIDEFATPADLLPNQQYPKRVAAKNTGDIGTFVRILAFPELKQAELVRPIASKDIQVDYQFGAPDDWLLGEDGYYYYLKKLAPGKETPPLFTSVRLRLAIDKQTEATYKKATFQLAVKLEAVDYRLNEYRFAWWGNRNDGPTEATLQKIDDYLQKEMR